MNHALSQIHTSDIYAGFTPMAEDLTGWGGDQPIFSEMIRLIRPNTIIEVGTWKGMSAVAMGEACRKESLDSAIICVDTWLGNENHILDGPDLKPKHGYPTIYYQFLSNVVHHKLQDIIVPLPNTSFNAAIALKKLEISADLIYIDGAHEYESVMQDLKSYVPLLSKRGTMFGHDYFWGSVAQALKDFCSSSGATHTVDKDGVFWTLSV
jgi:hypothetical protein